ncbi:DNA primase [Candidatus Sneabacter namystus]|uniref:DNA primase n=1 Tax=Candidatus Sneabacter namystus TaxID=2601646 RepID=A0A5C0UIB7_9RICK|nr:DNA primase [Candidatus Sneabacter namystus]QEK39517.1 DNA primase [Candidatus Sneabacter namystus]
MSDSIFKIVKNTVDILEVVQKIVKLRKGGKSYSGLCPFHQEKTPSFHVNTENNFYKCFGCLESGDVIKFTSQIKGITYYEAAVQLAQEYNIQWQNKSYSDKETKTRQLLEDILELASDFFQKQIKKNVVQYLNNRNVSDQLIEDFNIGYAPGHDTLIQYLQSKKFTLDNMADAGLIAFTTNTSEYYEIFRQRIMLPIKNLRNATIGFGGRGISLNTVPKYLNSPETKLFNKSRILFAQEKAFPIGRKKNSIILVEGYFDVIAMHAAGYTNTVAALGTSITEKHLKTLWEYADEIVLCLDQDTAGKKALTRIMQIALGGISEVKKISVVYLPFNSDPDSAINDKKIDIKNLVESRLMLSEAIWKNTDTIPSSRTPEYISKIRTELKLLIHSIKDLTLRNDYNAFFKQKIKDKFYKKIAKRNKTHTQNTLPLNHNICSDSAIFTDIRDIELSLAALLLFYVELKSSEEEVSQVNELILDIHIQDQEIETLCQEILTKKLQGQCKYTDLKKTCTQILQEVIQYTPQKIESISTEACIEQMKTIANMHKLKMLEIELCDTTHSEDKNKAYSEEREELLSSIKNSPN